jgi:cellobiose phosphorylase
MNTWSILVMKLFYCFPPPFKHTPLDPGYIKGYLPGVRENGGQYTHAASWVVIATALLGQRKRAFELFSFLNPVNHTLDLARTNCYKLEPYVLAGDIYSNLQNVGRGGWSWYTERPAGCIGQVLNTFWASKLLEMK